ncbi:MAG: transcriptional repressor NrdR [Clostridia bacterium]|nr:transcriptional repressor NrdR [Clostridia bacterium]
MKCPFCGTTDSKVTDTRVTDDGERIRRRRECVRCARRFTTYEQIEQFPVLVVKKDGKREAFDRNKLLGGVMKACEKRPVSAAALEALVSEIEQSVRNSFEHEVSTTDIGEMVMDGLRKLDQVAYVRFASVYRQFKDIDTFFEEIGKLKQDKTL